MMHTFRTLWVSMALTAAGLLLSACTAPKPAVAPQSGSEAAKISYAVSGETVLIVSAVTPYDGEPGVRDVFLHWFKRGFENGLAGRPPLMIEWDTAPAAKAGQKGYDFGEDEAERYLKNAKETNAAPQTSPIPPG